MAKKQAKGTFSEGWRAAVVTLMDLGPDETDEVEPGLYRLSWD